MVALWPVPPKLEHLVVNPKMKGKMKLTLEDGTQEVYSLDDVTNVRKIGQTEGQLRGSMESTLSVDADRMVQGLRSPQNPQDTSGQPSAQQASDQASDVQPASVAQQGPEGAMAQPINPFLPTSQMLPNIILPHVPSSYFSHNTSLSPLSGFMNVGGSTQSLPCYYPSTWGVPSQMNLAHASRWTYFSIAFSIYKKGTNEITFHTEQKFENVHLLTNVVLVSFSEQAKLEWRKAMLLQYQQHINKQLGLTQEQIKDLQKRGSPDDKKWKGECVRIVQVRHYNFHFCTVFLMLIFRYFLNFKNWKVYKNPNRTALAIMFVRISSSKISFWHYDTVTDQQIVLTAFWKFSYSNSIP